MLRQYQKDAILKVRSAFSKHQHVFLTLPTGGGKTIIFSEIAKRATQKGRNVWIVVPRNELIWQASEKLINIGVQHGVIAPGYEESSLYDIHIVSKDTWIRRKEKIKTPPQFVIVDEGHLATDRYVEMEQEYPDAFFLFVSATPERLDRKPLTAIASRDALVNGPSIKWLIEHQYLSRVKYRCPPVSGLDNLKRTGTEIDAEQLEQWLQEKKVYGSAIEHYRKYCTGRQSIIYCRSVELSKKTAEKFQDAGFNIESIDGKMSRSKIRSVIDAVKDGTLDGVSSCDLITYGLDVPNVSAIVMLRPTLSRPIYYQMLGRGLRYLPDKDHCVVLDHVGNAIRHCGGNLPWDPVDWRYEGRPKGRKRAGEVLGSVKYCPYLDFMPCDKQSCVGCPENPGDKPIKEWTEVDGELVAITGEISIKERPKEEKDFYSKKIEDLRKQVYKNGIVDGEIVKELVSVAKETNKKPLWVYFYIRNEIDPPIVENNPGMRFIDEPLLFAIQKHAGYKIGWVKFAKDIILGNIKKG